jgi:anthranilate synthase component 1
MRLGDVADFSNNLDSCIAIRTLVVRGSKGHIQAGGGIVDSVPENEYMKPSTNRALIRAINLAQRGSNHDSCYRW